MIKLTDKQEKFVQELIKGKSQREAYRIAYPSSIKWVDNSVDINASKLFNSTKVQLRYNEIHDRLIKEAEDECIVSAKDVLKELVKIAFTNGSDFAKITTKPVKRQVINPTNGEWEEKEVEEQAVELIDTDKLTNDKRAAISCIKETRHGISVESCDKVKALELLGKHLNLFTDKEIQVNINNNPFQGLTTDELKKLIMNG
jgi:phage terminase small subunit